MTACPLGCVSLNGQARNDNDQSMETRWHKLGLMPYACFESAEQETSPPEQTERVEPRGPATDAKAPKPGLSQSFGVYPALSMRAPYAPPNRRWPMILNALVEKLKHRSKDDFKGRHFEATLILQAVSWYLRYPLSYRDIEELFL